MIAGIAIVLIFGLLILLHEAGHFWAARLNGVRVEEFGIGIPPRIIGWRRGETLYSLNWVPIGGFVRVLGEGTVTKAKNKRSLSSKTVWQRMGFSVAGVFVNLLVAYLLMMVAFWGGMPPLVGEPAAYNIDLSGLSTTVAISTIAESSPAALSGLQAGDQIVEINGLGIADGVQVSELINDSGQNSVNLIVLRGGEKHEVDLRPTFDPESERYTVGIGLDTLIAKVKYDTLKVPWYALQEVWLLTLLVLQAIWGFLIGLFSGAGIAPDIVGPVGLISLGGQLITSGWLSLVRFAILLSTNLAVINIIPFPALDGGRLFFQILEVLRGRKLNPVLENRIHSLGFVLVLGLIFIITYRDILRFF